MAYLLPRHRSRRPVKDLHGLWTAISSYPSDAVALTDDLAGFREDKATHRANECQSPAEDSLPGCTVHAAKRCTLQLCSWVSPAAGARANLQTSEAEDLVREVRDQHGLGRHAAYLCVLHTGLPLRRYYMHLLRICILCPSENIIEVAP